MRNTHTHAQFLDLQLVTAALDVYDPREVLIETADGSEAAHVRRFLRREISRVATQYEQKARLVFAQAWRLREASNEHLKYYSKPSHPV